MEQTLEHYRQAVESYLQSELEFGEPAELYAHIRYILELGGKRMRPVLTLLGADLYGAWPEVSLPAAAAVEIFHNFSLVHDDIMDAAPLRRGRPSVHKKWNDNAAILSGDAMLILAYKQLETYEANLFKPMTALFSRTALEVCEGQQYDMDFEQRDDVSTEAYLEMIRLKTAVLLGCALQLGAVAGGASTADQQALYTFGINLGLAFQLQDDYLDAFGDPAVFGKQPGGDIIANKKTFLYLGALESLNATAAKELQDLFTVRPADPVAKVDRVLELFRQSGADKLIKEAIGDYTEKALRNLESVQAEGTPKALLEAFAGELRNRQY